MSTRALLGVAVLVAASLNGSAAPGSALADEFYKAIRANDLGRLDALLTNRANADARSDEGVTPLMYAAAVGSVDAMKRVIAAGADVNATNTAGSSALIWSAAEIAKTRLLLDHGADPNLTSKLGRNALLVAAKSDGSAETVKLLLAHGAKAQAVDKFKATALHGAALGGDVDTLRLLLDAHLDVNAKDDAGFTPLMAAASSGSTDGVRLLLSRGARANDVSGAGEVITHSIARAQNGVLAFGSFTALLLAAPTAPAPLVKALLDSGADVNAKDMRGMTALMLAVATDHSQIQTIQTLLASKADVNARSAAGETALDWAEKSGATPVTALLRAAGATRSAAAASPTLTPAPVALEPALTRTFGLLERTSGTQFFARGGCAACHAQMIVDVAASIARPKGVPLDEKEAGSRLIVTKRRFGASVPLLLERIDAAGSPDVPLYTALGLASSNYAPDWTTDGLVINIAAHQRRDGRWHFGWNTRPPIQDGDIFRTALGIRALKTYAPPALGSAMTSRLSSATRWLESAQPSTTEDRAMRLLGLRWGDSDRQAVADAVWAVVAAQRSDGGWAQRDEMSSDAYATGETLFALGAAGMDRTDPVFQRGVRFLLSTQQADGSWYVRSRSVKFQPYFESGFPYGSDQWISAMATGWAAAALATAVDPRPLAGGAR